MEETFAVDDDAGTTTATPATPAAPAAGADLSIAIARAVDKRPGEHVRVRRVGVNTYRCNWVANDASRTGGDLQSLTTWRIRESKFLRATKVQGRLVIEDATIRKTVGV
jgi:hypothetical protein